MSANLPNISGGDPRSGKMSRRNGAEPLKRFTEAKKAIGEIYNDLEGYVNDLSSFYHEVINGQNIVPEQQMGEVERFMDTIKTIKEIFHRDTMKVVFFGRTSNGKSSVINAMLHSKVLPQGMGHTTCCFLQVEGGSENEKYLICEDSPRHHDIKELQKLGHAMSADNLTTKTMGQDSLVRILYPKSASKLLQNDVVILDSPGVDLSPEFDSWIDKHCLDADVFVLVCNAESTLTQSEKSFFVRVSSRLSRPNIFILNNRWDASASYIDCDSDGTDTQLQIEKVREQHMLRFKQFLVDELKVCNETEAKNRIFFISAREMLDARLKLKGLISKAYQMDGHQYRAMEFTNFESQFEQIISKSAINTKFEAHQRRAREIVAAMRANIEIVNNVAVKKRESLEEELRTKQEIFKQCYNNWKEFERSAFTEVKRLRAEVHLKVSADFYEEIYRLEAIIDKFDYKFVDEPRFIADYKKALAEYIDKTISDDLEARCTGGLMQRIWNLENEMFQHVHGIISEPYTRKLEEIWRYRPPFRFSIRVNCPQLVEDFEEDLEFCFSLGVTSLIRRFIAYRSGQPVTAIRTKNLLLMGALGGGDKPNGDNQPKDQATTSAAAVVGGEGVKEVLGVGRAMENSTKSEEGMVISQLVFTGASYVANGGLGLIVVGGLVYRTLGWRVITGCALAYGGLYALERWRWNSGAKEQHLKEQFKGHLGMRMKNVTNAHTAHCEAQVVREMECVYNGLKATVGGVHREMKDELDTINKKIEKTDTIVKGLGTIKGKTTFLNTDLDRFSNEFLKPDSPTQ